MFLSYHKQQLVYYSKENMGLNWDVAYLQWIMNGVGLYYGRLQKTNGPIFIGFSSFYILMSPN